MIKLKFTTRIVVAEQYERLPLKIIRLIAYIQLLKGDGLFTERFEAIVDTGAHTSVIPKRLWETLQCKIQAENVWLSGINDRPECRISASIGEVTGMIIDDDNHHTEALNFTAFLVSTDRVPLILGISGILDKYHLSWDYQNQNAYLKKKRRRPTGV